MEQRKVYEIVRIARRRDLDHSETDIALSIMEAQRESPERLAWLEEASAQEIADWIIDQFEAYNAELVEAEMVARDRTRRAAERLSDIDAEPEVTELEAAQATIERLTALLQRALESLESRESVVWAHNLIADIRRELETAAE